MIELTGISLLNAGKAYSLKKVILEDFKKLLPIEGGWGYSEDDSIIIDKNDPELKSSGHVDGISIEYFIVEKRLYEELIIFRQPPNKFSNINWVLLKQELFSNNGKMFDYLQFEVTCFKDVDWENLKKEYEYGITNSKFDIALHEKHIEKLKCMFITEYYFDITSFHKGAD